MARDVVKDSPLVIGMHASGRRECTGRERGSGVLAFWHVKQCAQIASEHVHSKLRVVCCAVLCAMCHVLR